MVGIDVGVSEITFSNGEVIPTKKDTPPDLLTRVANNLPHVTVRQGRCELRSAAEFYADAVAHALSGRPTSDGDTFRAALAVPGWWTPRAIGRVSEALAALPVDIVLVNDAEAAVLEYRHESASLPAGVAVVNLRAQQTGVVVVRNDSNEPEALVSPILVHEEGGAALDIAVLQHIVRGLVDLGHKVDTRKPEVIAAAQQTLASCRALRESLSTSAFETIESDLPEVTERIRVVRNELEEIAAPWADAVVQRVATAIEQSPIAIEAVLLTGGLANMPLISQRLSADLALEVHVPEAPTLIAVRGAERTLKSLPSAIPEPELELETDSEPQRVSLWQSVRGLAATFRPQRHEPATRTSNDQPHDHTIETLLDSNAAEPSSARFDLGWIPSTRKHASLR